MNQSTFYVGKVDNINRGEHFKNVTIKLEDKKLINIKLDRVDESALVMGRIYQFEVAIEMKNDIDTFFQCVHYDAIEDILKPKAIDALYDNFYEVAPKKISEIKKGIEGYIARIQHQDLSAIVSNIYHTYQHAFYTHPAATKFHHAYVGGLSYHTLTMLEIAEKFFDIYPYLNQDLMIAGTLLHDMSKIGEMTGVDGEYTTEGLLIGHLVMQAMDIDQTASALNVKDTEIVMLLKHMMLSHHGLPNFGAAKKPQIPEALLLWYIDTIDSKFTVLGEELEKTKEGQWTNALNVLDKMKFYKSKQ
jgi:3'-5' exoribonuclease